MRVAPGGGAFPGSFGGGEVYPRVQASHTSHVTYYMHLVSIAVSNDYSKMSFSVQFLGCRIFCQVWWLFLFFFLGEEPRSGFADILPC